MSKQKSTILIVVFSVLLTGCASISIDSDGAGFSGSNSSAPEVEDYRIITLLPKDAIPSIDNPRFYSVSEADEEYDPEEIVLGVVFDGEARAYSANMLSSHEIVNDNVAGRPIAVTW